MRPKSFSSPLFLVLSVVFCAGWAAPSFGQIPFLKSSIDTSFIPENACLAAVVRPSELAEKEEFDLFPREIVTAYGLKNFGFDPMKVKQATILLETPENMMQPPAYGFVVRFGELQGISDEVLDARKQKQIGDYVLYSADSPAEPSYLVIDEVTVLVGEEDFIQTMAKSNRNENLVKMMKSPAVNGNAFAFVDFTVAKPLLTQLASQLPPMLPPQIRNLKELPELLIGAELGVKFNIDFDTSLKLHTREKGDAEKAQKIIQEALELGRQMMVGSMAADLNSKDPVSQATREYAQRMSSWYGENLSPQLSDASLSINLSNQESLGPVLIGMLLPAAQSARAAARRTASMNNQRQMAIAMHIVADATGGFPAQANYDQNGKPLLSWRVHILPYIDQQELYEQFRLDEPWNSSHNKKLIEKIPLVYVSPAVGDLGGRTVYLGNATEGGLFGDTKLPLSDIKDGLSKTIAIVEVDPAMAVEWTRPADFKYNPNQPFGGLGGVHPGGFNAALADGSVHFFSRSLDPEIFKNMLLSNNGK